MSSKKRPKDRKRPTITSHDRFAKKCLPVHGIAEDLLRFYADPILEQEIDLDNLQPAPTHSVNSELKEIVRDVTFLTHLKNTKSLAEVMFLLEHKSRPSHCVALQLGTQAFFLMHSRWTEANYTASKKFTPPIPIMIVLYHGKEKWAAKEIWFQDVFKEIVKNLPPELRSLVPQFRIIVINLARFSYDNLPGRPLTRAFVESLKRAKDGTFAESIDRIFQHVRDAGQNKEQADDFIKTVLTYCKHSDPLTADQLEKALVKVFEESEGMEMYKAYSTGFTAEAFKKGRNLGREEGVKKGLKKGVKKGVIKGVKKGEKKGVKKGEAKSIVKVLRIRFENVSSEIVKSLKKVKETAVLDSLLTSATKCSTLDEFIQTLQNVSNDQVH